MRTDRTIAKVGSLNPISTCKASLATPGMQIAGATMTIHGKNGAPDQTLSLFDESLGAVIETEYKLYCDKLLGGDKLEMLVAVIGTPSWISVDTEYEGFGQSRAKRESFCLISKCATIQSVVR